MVLRPCCGNVDTLDKKRSMDGLYLGDIYDTTQ